MKSYFYCENLSCPCKIDISLRGRCNAKQGCSDYIQKQYIKQKSMKSWRFAVRPDGRLLLPPHFHDVVVFTIMGMMNWNFIKACDMTRFRLAEYVVVTRYDYRHNFIIQYWKYE